MITMHGQFNTANVLIDEIDEATREQIQAFLNHPAFKGGYIAIMPDCHAGKGSCIGFTMKGCKYVLPNIVGVDIGCGVRATNLGKIKPDLVALDKFIHNEVPHGFKIHEKPLDGLGEPDIFHQIAITCEIIGYDPLRADRSVGTLGGGNHFIELDVDEMGDIWLLVHSGSRNFGLSVAEHYRKQARREMGDYFLGDAFPGLEFFPPNSSGYDAYLWAQADAVTFARINRGAIARLILKHLEAPALGVVESVHNYIDTDDGMIRKGAISADQGELCVIPFNMRDGAVIGVGKGNNFYNCSAPHGAGRLMSRTTAKKTLDVDWFKAQMIQANVFTTTANKNTLDEAPDAYKPADTIRALLADTVEITHTLKPIYNFKAAE